METASVLISGTILGSVITLVPAAITLIYFSGRVERLEGENEELRMWSTHQEIRNGQRPAAASDSYPDYDDDSDDLTGG